MSEGTSCGFADFFIENLTLVEQQFLPLLALSSFNRACSDRTRSNGFELREGRFGLDARKK